MPPFLLADIGGTNARFSLIYADNANEAVTSIYVVRENPTLIGALKRFCDEHAKGQKITAAAIAVAGPVLSDKVKLTNSDWVADKEEIQTLLGTEHVHLFNDFEAIALAVNALGPEDTDIMQQGEKSAKHPILVMGPGTGLGVAAVANMGKGQILPFTTESGHTRYAPANEREHKIIDLLSQNLSFVTAENLISGPGLVRLFQANCLMANKPVLQCEPADIVTWARQGDSLCRQVLDDFSAIFGSFASQMALSWISLGGVYLTGGVLEKMKGDFVQQRFLKRFGSNPDMSHLLAKMPIHRVTTDIPAFRGLKSFLSLKYP